MRSTLISVVLLLLAVSYGGTLDAQDGAAGQAAAATAGPAASPGDPAAGKALWAVGNTSCRNCHGGDGEGGYGPILAGRKLPYARFLNYVRNPLGRMPAYLDAELSDKEVTDMVAYLDSLPAVATPGPWRFPLPEGAPRGQQLALSTIGCAQCHGPTFETPRNGAAEVNGDFEWFKRMVYDHASAQREQWSQLDPNLRAVTPYPAGPAGRNRVRMGNYSRARLPEATLREIWNWAVDLGFLVPLSGTISAGASGADGVTYTLTVANAGVKNKGVVAEDVTIALAVPAQGSVASATGMGYQGVRHDEEAKGDVAVWRVPRLGPTDQQTLTITFSGPISGAELPRGTIRWARPAVKADDVVAILPPRVRR